MHPRSRLALATLAAALALSLAPGVTNASRSFELEPGGSILLAFPELEFHTLIGRISCPVTLHGSLHRLIAKTAEALTGFVTGALITAASCVGSGGVRRDGVRLVTALNLPWHVQFSSFAGALPNGIASIRLVLVNMQLLSSFADFFGSSHLCLYRGNQPLDATVETGQIRRVSVVEVPIALFRDLIEGGCPAEGELLEELGGTLTPTQTVRLK